MDRKLASAVIAGSLAMGGAVVAVDFNSVESTLGREQSAYFEQNGKYLQVKKGERQGIEVTEYVAPNGKGYQVLEKEQREDGIYQRSYGEGVEADGRSYDWTLIEDTSVVASTTPVVPEVKVVVPKVDLGVATSS